jgi:hypothetical protein
MKMMAISFMALHSNGNSSGRPAGIISQAMSKNFRLGRKRFHGG